MLHKQKILLWYYIATPAFFLADIFLGWDMRASFLDDHQGWKYIYYLFCFCIGILMWKIPLLESVLGIIEGGVNILLLTLSVLVPYYAAIDAISSGVEVVNPMNHFSIINYLLTGSVLIISMQLRGARIN